MNCSCTGCCQSWGSVLATWWTPVRRSTPRETMTSSPKSPTLTGTLRSRSECWPRRSSATLPWPGEEHTDLILRIWVEVPNLITRGIHWLPVIPAPTCCAVLHLSGDNGSVPIDGVGVELYPQVGRPHWGQLRWGNWYRWFWKANPGTVCQTLWSSVLKELSANQLVKYRRH